MKQLIAGLAVICASACGGDGGGITNPDDSEAIEGLRLSAAVVSFRANDSSTANNEVYMVSVHVTLSNTTTSPITHHYPAGCGVRMRFYRRTNDALAYDEAAVSCPPNSLVELTIAPGASVDLVSGVRAPWDIIGDSLPAGTYRVTGVLRITGEAPIELEAGNHNVQECDLRLFPVFTCRYVE